MPISARSFCSWTLVGCEAAPLRKSKWKSPKSMVPACGISITLMERRKVDLPEPEAPMIETTSPCATSSETPLSTSKVPKLLRISRKRRSGAASVMPLLPLHGG